MGALSAPLSIASTVFSGLDKVNQAKQQRRMAEYNEQENNRKYEIERKRLLEEKKQASATLRARMSSQGGSLNDGSSAAIINRLNQKANDQLGNINQSYLANRRRSLLEDKGRFGRINQGLSLYNNYF